MDRTGLYAAATRGQLVPQHRRRLVVELYANAAQIGDRVLADVAGEAEQIGVGSEFRTVTWL